MVFTGAYLDKHAEPFKITSSKGSESPASGTWKLTFPEATE